MRGKTTSIVKLAALIVALEREDGTIWTGRGKRKYTPLITFANIMSYFCFVFHHTASAYSVKLFLKYYKRHKF